MTDYMGADLKRLFTKKGTYFCLLAVLVISTIFSFIQISNITEKTVLDNIDLLLSLMTTFAGVMLFISVYTDDLSAGALSQIIGFGKQRYFLVLEKFVINCLFAFVFYILALTMLYGLFTFLGVQPPLNGSLQIGLNYFLVYIGISMFVGIFVYGLQSVSVSVIAFIILTVGTIDSLLSMVLEMKWFVQHFGDLNGWLFSKLVPHLVENPDVWKLLAYFAYLFIPLGLTMVAFNKKELEF